jgi:CHAT domain-containing protein/tetratricopeptide (TPR) repeat protein
MFRTIPFLICGFAFGSSLADEPKAAPSQPIISPNAPKLTVEQRRKLREHDRLRPETSRLRMAGKWDECLAAAEKMVAIDREVFGNSHPLVAQALTIVAEVQMGRHDFVGAQRAWEEVLKIQQSWGGADHWRVKDARRILDRVKRVAGLDAKQLTRLDDLDRRLRELVAQRRFDQAGQLIEEFLGAQKELLGEQHQDLNTFALLAGLRMGRSLLESEKLWRQFLEVCKATRGEEHPEYAKGLTQLGAMLIERGGRDEAKKSFDRAARIYLMTLRAFDLDYAPWVLHLARMQAVLLRQADRAESLVRLSAEIYEACRGDTDPQYAECLNQLGHMHYDRQSYAQAETLFKQLIEIRKATVGDKDPQYAQSLLALAMVYHAKGSAELATPLYAEAKRIQQQTPKQAVAAGTAPALREEASRQVSAGNNSEAEKLYLKLLDVDRRTIGTKHPDYATDLWRLAGLYQSMRADRKAEELYEQAAEIFKQTLGEKHRQYRTTLEGLARLAMQRGDYRKADSLYQQLQALYRESDGEDSFRYAFTLDQRGEICKAEGDLEGAAALFEKSLPIFRTRLGQQGLLLTARLSGLAELYTRQHNYERAEPFLRECLTCNEKTLEEIFSLQSERQRLDALRRARRILDEYVNIAQAAGKSDATALYEHVLRWKGAGAARGQVRLAREQPELKDAFDRWAKASARLTELAYAPPTAGEEEAWLRQLHTLRNEKENLESDIARRSEAFRWQREGGRIEPKEVANVLPERTVLVDFFEYSGTQEERRLLAFVLRRGHEPVCIEIEGYKGIMRNIEIWRSALLTAGSRAETAATELRDKLWKPLEQAVGRATTVLVAPDGGLAYFPLSALPGARPGTFLLEELAIGYVTSGRQVMEALRAPEGERGHGLLAVGGIDYRADAGAVVRLEPDKTPLVDAESRAGFGPLPGTELEARRCQELFRQSFPSERATLLTGAAPSETRFVRECGERYRYLHLATHGFFESPLRVAAIVASERPTASALFYADRGQPGQALARLPLLRCGLALAGAGRPPRPGFAANGGGILTAEEVASLDLRATDVAVLSACQTGLGEVERGEGVLGFQRAFHQAGTRALVATLWSVDDAATSLLMEEFYANLWHLRMPKLEALRQAQLSILRNPDRVKARREELKKILLTKIHEAKAGAAETRGDIKRTPPLLWAAFVLSGDPR